MRVLSAKRFTTTQRIWNIRATTMLVASDTTDYPTLTAPSTGGGKAAARLIVLLFDVDTLQRAIDIGNVVNFIIGLQVINGAALRVPTDNHLLDLSENAHM